MTTQKIIKTYEHWTLCLHESQYYLGRVCLWAKNGQGRDFIDLNDDEQREFFIIGKRIKSALNELFQPDRYNYAALSNICPDLHVHIIPRYKTARNFDGIEFTDHNWGKNFDPFDETFQVSHHTIESLCTIIKNKIET